MSSQGDRDQKALNEVKSYLESTGRKAPDNLLTRSKKTYEVLAKLVVSKVQAPAKPNAQSYIRSAAEAPVQPQAGVEGPDIRRTLAIVFWGIIGLAVLVGIIIVVQRYAQSQSDFKLAQQAMKDNNPQLAVAELNRAYQLGFQSPQVHMLRGDAYLAVNDSQKAVDDFSAVLKQDPHSAEALLGCARGYISLKQYDHALAECNTVLEVNPNYPEVLALRAVALAKLGKFSESIDDCSRFLSLSKDAKANLDIEATRANDYVQLGKPDLAIKDLDSVIKANPGQTGLQLLRARCSLAQGNDTQAITDLTAELKLDPRNIEAQTLRAKTYLKMNKDREALSDLNTVLQSAPAIDLYLARAAIYMNLKEYEPAVDDYDRAMSMKPATAELKAKREEAWEQLKKYKPMIATMKQSIRDAMGFSAPMPQLQGGADELTARGYSLYRKGKFDEAIDVLSVAVQKNPSSAPARRYLAYACMSVGNCVDASQQFQTLMGLGPLDESDQMQYARALTGLGRAEEAIELLKDVIANNPNNSWARMSLIKLYLDAGATGKAARLSLDGMNSATNPAERAAYANFMRASGGGH